jgi:hypothetical protein
MIQNINLIKSKISYPKNFSNKFISYKPIMSYYEDDEDDDDDEEDEKLTKSKLVKSKHEVVKSNLELIKSNAESKLKLVKSASLSLPVVSKHSVKRIPNLPIPPNIIRMIKNRGKTYYKMDDELLKIIDSTFKYNGEFCLLYMTNWKDIIIEPYIKAEPYLDKQIQYNKELFYSFKLTGLKLPIHIVKITNRNNLDKFDDIARSGSNGLIDSPGLWIRRQDKFYKFTDTIKDGKKYVKSKSKRKNKSKRKSKNKLKSTRKSKKFILN